jgi:hypothetical protein
MKHRTLLIRAAVILFILILSVVMFIIGKSHTILVDNKSIDDYQALQLVEVQVGKQPMLELTARDRDKFDVTGQRHIVRVVYTDRQWEEHVIERKITLPLMQDMVMILLPVLVANPDAEQSLWLENYEVPAFAVMAQPDEEVVTDDLAGLITDVGI